MKRLYTTFLFLAAFIVKVQAQVKLDDFGRIVLNTYLPDDMSVPAEAKQLLYTKLTQVAASAGMGGSQANPRFVITAKVNIGSKDIVAGPPQMVAQNVDVTMIIGDAVAGAIFSTVTINLKGVGTNENKAFIEAFKTINTQNKDVVLFLEDGKNKIINYYSTNCDFLIKDANTLAEQGKYDEAIYNLSLVPDVCKDCYFKCLDILAKVYQDKIDADCIIKVNAAKAKWAAKQNSDGAEQAGEIISSIDPMAACQHEVAKLISTIDAKLKADAKALWDMKVRKYKDRIALQKERMRITEEKGKRDDQYRDSQGQRNLELDKMRVSAFRAVATEYARNQPKSVTYNNILTH
jgi:hypothetical protein